MGIAKTFDYKTNIGVACNKLETRLAARKAPGRDRPTVFSGAIAVLQKTRFTVYFSACYRGSDHGGQVMRKTAPGDR
jgi:hypothetical protein